MDKASPSSVWVASRSTLPPRASLTKGQMRCHEKKVCFVAQKLQFSLSFAQFSFQPSVHVKGLLLSSGDAVGNLHRDFDVFLLGLQWFFGFVAADFSSGHVFVLQKQVCDFSLGLFHRRQFGFGTLTLLANPLVLLGDVCR